MKIVSQWFAELPSRAGIAFMQALAFLPFSWIRALGTALGWALYALVGSRRRVVQTNLALCFPERSEAERRRLAQQTFVYFAQAWLDRAWLWHAPQAWVQRRVRLTGAVQELAGSEATVVFCPHFVGLDAAWAAIALAVPRQSTTIYTDQSNKLVNQWILRGRQRFGHLRLFGRIDGVKPIVSALREGQPLYLLPDMDFGPDDSVFVPFYGLPTATVPSLSRFARLGRAKVVPLLPRITAGGYEIQVLPAWTDFPTDDLVADTALMNARLQDYIATMPAQYYWVHKRFKTRPDDMPSMY
ncbi:KDO2-lipid IV(A) lauroyltransferase [Polaromonas sp. OV174]|uniref:lysophospholipid acyltransferase family protein n=1 Tax=Polaromonas sp. OV174 TaxID=1855300 RepID=UPI0008F0EA7A|nr:lipid A biosynthesis acyltransferase [Polaromonas sp. OV174]SFC00905.1 KDO2-lipid IV(A) lauroyltransferase [Polaromonas sp. OV174]